MAMLIRMKDCISQIKFLPTNMRSLIFQTMMKMMTKRTKTLVKILKPQTSINLFMRVKSSPHFHREQQSQSLSREEEAWEVFIFMLELAVLMILSRDIINKIIK